MLRALLLGIAGAVIIAINVGNRSGDREAYERKAATRAVIIGVVLLAVAGWMALGG